MGWSSTCKLITAQKTNKEHNHSCSFLQFCFQKQVCFLFICFHHLSQPINPHCWVLGTDFADLMDTAEKKMEWMLELELLYTGKGMKVSLRKRRARRVWGQTSKSRWGRECIWVQAWEEEGREETFGLPMGIEFGWREVNKAYITKCFC